MTDDGTGIPDGAVRHSAQLGHIGLTSHTLRVEAAGGTLRLLPGPVAGTEVFVDVPWPEA